MSTQDFSVENMKMLSEEIEDVSSKLALLSAKVPTRFEMVKKELDLCDGERDDLLHKIEIETCNAYQGWMLYRDLQITLKKRRELKDEVSSLARLMERLELKDSLNSHTEKISQSMASLRRNREARVYSVRVRKDLINNSSIVSRRK